VRVLKVSLPVSLIALVVFLSALQNVRDAVSDQRRDQSHKTKSYKQDAAAQNQETISLAILDAIRAIVNEQAAKRRQDHADHEDWDTKPFWLMFGLNAVLVIVGALYTIAAFRQLGAIERQAVIADQALIIGREPYLVPTNFELVVRSIGIVKTLGVSYKLKNYGFGPAFVEQLMVICEARQALKQPPSYMGASIQFSTIGKVIGPSEMSDDTWTGSKVAWKIRQMRHSASPSIECCSTGTQKRSFSCMDMCFTTTFSEKGT
jgi:hypothetical protein